MIEILLILSQIGVGALITGIPLFILGALIHQRYFPSKGKK